MKPRRTAKKKKKKKNLNNTDSRLYNAHEVLNENDHNEIIIDDDKSNGKESVELDKSNEVEDKIMKEGKKITNNNEMNEIKQINKENDI